MIENANALLSLSVIVLAGLFGGYLARKVKLPHITGQILVGIVLGQSVLNLFGPGVARNLATVTEFALGFIALTVGEHLNVRTLRNAGKRLFFLLVTESIITPVIVIAVSYPFLKSMWLPLLLGAMAVSTAPATVIALIKESRAKGVFVKTLSAAVALNNIACIVLFGIMRAIVSAGMGGTGEPHIGALLLSPALKIGEAVLLGGGAGALLIVATRREVRKDRLTAASLIALLFVGGLSLYFDFSLLLSCLFLGVTLANFSPRDREIGVATFENMEPAIFAAFFTLAGMELDVSRLLAAGVVSIVVVVGRMVGKLLSANLAMRAASATPRVRGSLGLALIPQAGVAVGLILLVQGDPTLRPLHDMILEIGLTTVMINELLGSVTTHFALRRSGEVGRDRPRLMDFVDEEHIVTGFQAESKEEAIRKLADLLLRTHEVKVDREEFLKSILERESEASTCLGEGLAIPHGTLAEGEQMVGVMGLNREGLPFETPDGRPVHCMVLLATPPSERERHLQVMSSLARWIGRDPEAQELLFNAESPAHAHDVLHAEEAETYNYYLSE